MLRSQGLGTYFIDELNGGNVYKYTPKARMEARNTTILAAFKGTDYQRPEDDGFMHIRVMGVRA